MSIPRDRLRPAQESGSGRHWLADLVVHDRVDQAGTCAISADADIHAAWDQAIHACGIGEDELATHVAAHFNLQPASLATAEPRVLRLVPERLARRYNVFPLRENDRDLVIATADPTDLQVEDDLGFASGRRIVMEIAPPGAIRDTIGSVYAPDASDEPVLPDLEGDYEDAVKVLQDAAPQAVDAKEIESAPVIKLTNIVLRTALAERASDIHIEPGRNSGLVRFRVDGVLRTYMKMPLPALNRVVSRIKIMSKLDIADRLRPQDGRASISVEGQSCDLRVSTVPTRFAEKVVIRLLAQGSTMKLADLGLPEAELRAIRDLISQRNGIVAVTGPTGSGKTTTLYAAIRELATGEVNIMTVEDPVEYEIAGITQIQVETRRGLTFASALRALLRQDPDVILVGEIRDLETAQIAVQASMTGHLVLATLHTNDAVGAVQRLVDLGLDHASIATTLRGVISQRLVRSACKCAVPASKPLSVSERRLADALGVQPAVRATGCRVCTQSGYRGRTSVLEVLTVQPAVRELIARGASIDEIQRAARAGGMRPIHDMGRQLVRDGVTTLEEVDRVIGTGAGASSTGAAAAGNVIPLAAPAASPAAAQPARILVAEDDAVNRKVARGMLGKAGHTVEECNDGQQAIERLEKDPSYSLLLLDLDMPKVGGRQVLDWVRRNPATAQLPVIVFTATAGENLEAELMEAGADDYIRKPLDPARFGARVKAALRRAAG